jgi:hypothetical protein
MPALPVPRAAPPATAAVRAASAIVATTFVLIDSLLSLDERHHPACG